MHILLKPGVRFMCCTGFVSLRSLVGKGCRVYKSLKNAPGSRAGYLLVIEMNNACAILYIFVNLCKLVHTAPKKTLSLSTRGAFIFLQCAPGLPKSSLGKRARGTWSLSHVCFGWLLLEIVAEAYKVRFLLYFT